MSETLRDPRRVKSEEIAFRAEQAWAAGKRDIAQRLFAEAAVMEEAVAREVGTSSPRLRSLLAISAAALWYKAANLGRAKHVAYSFLAQDEGLSKQGRRELEQLVDQCSREAEIGEIGSDMLPVVVKLDGGRVRVGVAPAGAARDRGRAATSLLTRAAEYAEELEYRERGGSDLDRQDAVHVYEVPALAASYGLRFYIATGSKRVDATKNKVVPLERIVQTFLALAEAAASGPAAVRKLVPDPRYAQAFITGFGDLAPDGEDIARVECSSPTWRLAGATRTVLEPEHRQALRAPGDAGVQDRRVRARVVAASLTRSTIELELLAAEPGALELEKIDGSVVTRSRNRLRGLVLDNVYDFDLTITRTTDAAGHEQVKLEIRSATGASLPQEAADTAPAEARRPSRAALRWSKLVTPTDVLQNDGNKRPYVQLTRSGQPIDHATWFRKELFADAAWGPGVEVGGQEAIVEFDVLVGKDVASSTYAIGTYRLRLSHVPDRSKHNGQPATRLHWSGEVRTFLERNDFGPKYLVLQRDRSGRHQLMILDEQPVAVT